jgi:hypothetical protein
MTTTTLPVLSEELLHNFEGLLRMRTTGAIELEVDALILRKGESPEEKIKAVMAFLNQTMKEVN